MNSVDLSKCAQPQVKDYNLQETQETFKQMTNFFSEF